MSRAVPRFCSSCGGALCERMVERDRRVRSVCERCGAIAYKNPQLLVSTIVAAEDQVLLCLRAHAPAAGRWGLPGGFMECDETLEEAAVRETFEETGIQLDPASLRLHTVATLLEISEVYIGFVVSLDEMPVITCGHECADVRFFDEAKLPWDQITYPDVAQYLRRFFEERRNGEHAIHLSRLDASGVYGNTYRVAATERVHRLRAPRED